MRITATRETTIPLKAGLHPITVKVTMPAEDLNPTLSVDWTIDGTRSPIPDTALFSKSASL